MRTGLLSMAAGLLLASAASAAVETANVQWPLDGSTQPAGLDLTVYSRVLKTGCTGNCDLVGCEDLEASLFFRPQGGSWSSVAMALNTADCYAPQEEYSGVIPGVSMAGSFIDFYVEYHDTADDTYYYADGFDSAAPAQYVLSALTTQDFTYSVCLNTCNLPQGTLNPGIAGPFNSWSFTNLVDGGDGIWCYDLVVPAGSAPSFDFKFRNNADWESLPGGPFANRNYQIAPGSTADADTFLWNDEECAGLPTELVNSLLVIFTLDMSYQDPASYSGGVSIQGSTAPLTWTPGATMMTAQGGGVFTTGLMFPAGSPTNIEFKFTRNDGVDWFWEDGNNNPLFLNEAGGSPQTVAVHYWNNYQPPQVTTVDVSVTFSLDMNCLDPASYAGGVSVTGGGDVLGNWTPGVNLLTDGNNDGIFETTLVYPAGSAFNWEHKFNLSADGMNWGWEDNVANRPFTISDANTNQVLATVAWDNWLCAPEVTIVRVGNSVQLSWDAVPAAASYNVYGDTDPYFVPAPGNLLGSTAGTTYNHVVVGNRLNFKVTANN
jgi:hypothetical protein